MATVRFLNSERSGQQISLLDGPIIFGRLPECDVPLADESVSRHHARISRREDGYYVEDLGSRNGTQVNGQRISEPMRLLHRDRIQIRSAILEFVDETETMPVHSSRETPMQAPEYGQSRSGDSSFGSSPVEYFATIAEIDFTNPGGAPGEVSDDVKLRAVLEITRSLRSSLEPEEILSRIVECVTEMFPHYSRSYLLRQDETARRLVPVVVKQPEDDVVGPVTLRPVAQAVARQVLKQGKAILSMGSPHDEQGESNSSVLDDGERSFMCAPIVGPSRTPAGILYIETHDEARRFTQDDLELFVCVAILAGQALEQAYLFGARYRAVVDTAADGIITISDTGIIESVNPAVVKLFGFPQEELLGRNVKLLMTDSDRQRYDAHLEEYARSGRGLIVGAGREAVARRQDGSTFPIYLSLGQFSLAGKRYFTGIVHDISQQHASEQALKRLNETLEQQVRERTESIRLLQDVAVIANGSDTVEQAFRIAMMRVCRFSNWEAGHVFLHSPADPGILADSGIWTVERTAKYKRLMSATAKTIIRPGEGLLGEVVSTKQPIWVADVALQPSFGRADEAVSAGLATVAACPVLVGNEVAAVVELFSANSATPDGIFLEVMRQVGTALGRVIERDRLQRQLVDAVWNQHRRLGQELHDTLGQALTGIGMLADSLTKRMQSQNLPEAAKLAEIGAMIQQAKTEVRQLSKGLYPVDVDAQGLSAALEDLALATEQRTHIPCVLTGDPEIQIPDNEVATHLYRIAQEAVLNAVKHGQPGKIIIGLKKTRGQVTLTVRDDGSGLPAPGTTSVTGRGLGTHIMRYRAAAMGAKLSMESADNCGTLVSCTLPQE